MSKALTVEPSPTKNVYATIRTKIWASRYGGQRCAALATSGDQPNTGGKDEVDDLTTGADTVAP